MGNVLEFKVSHMAESLPVDSGYIKLFRSLQDSAFSNRPEYVATWVHVLMLATHKPRRAMIGNNPISLLPGQFISGRKALAERVGITEKQMRGILDFFVADGMLTKQSSRAGTVFTVCNFTGFQGQEGPTLSGQQKGQAQATDHTVFSDAGANDKANEGPRERATTQENKNTNTKKRCQNSNEFGPSDDAFPDQPEGPAKQKKPSCPLKAIQQSYNDHLPTLTASRILSTKTQGQIRKLWNQSEQHQSLEFWQRYFADLNRLTNRVEFWSGGGVANGQKRGIDLITREDIFSRNVNELVDSGIWA